MKATFENFIIAGLMLVIVLMLVDFETIMPVRTASAITNGMLCGVLFMLVVAKTFGRFLDKSDAKKN